MSQRVVSILKGAAILTAVMVSSQAVAELRPEVVERIRPVGEVAVEGQAAPAAAPAPAEQATAAATPAPAPAATPAPAAPAAAPAASGGAAVYQAKGCPACHGPDADSPIMPVYPKLAGLPAEYAFNQMNDIKSGARSNGQSAVMKGIMAAVSEQEMRTIADWLSGLK